MMKRIITETCEYVTNTEIKTRIITVHLWHTEKLHAQQGMSKECKHVTEVERQSQFSWS